MGNLKVKKFYDRILISNASISQANGIYVLSPNLANGLRYYVKGADAPGGWAIAAGKESISQPFNWAIYLIGAGTYYYSTNSSFNSIFDLPAYPWECSWVDGNGNPVNIKLEPYANSTKKSISMGKLNFVVVSGSNTTPFNADGKYLLENTLVNGRQWYFKPSEGVPMMRIVFVSLGRWAIQYNLNNWTVLAVSTAADNPWEATWPSNIQVSFSNGKIYVN